MPSTSRDTQRPDPLTSPPCVPQCCVRVPVHGTAHGTAHCIAAPGGAAEQPWHVAVWVVPADLPSLAALGPAAVVFRCDSLAAPSAAVVGTARVARQDVAGLASLLAAAPAKVFAGIAMPSAFDDSAAARASERACARLERAVIRAVYMPIEGHGFEHLVRALGAARLADPVQRAGVAAVRRDL